MFQSSSLLLAIAGLACAATPVSFQTHYISLGQQDISIAIAADSAGDVFIVSQIVPRPEMVAVRVTKTDPQGNVLASFDFGAPYSTANAAAVDSEGNLFVAGITTGEQVIYNGFGSAFVVKLDGGLTHVVSSAHLGNAATGGTSALAIALDTSGNVYVSGSTFAPDFPTTPGAYQTTGPIAGFGYYYSPPFVPGFAFLTKFTGDLSKIVYSTLYGSASVGCQQCSEYATTSATGVAVDSAGVATIAGYTDSPFLADSKAGGFDSYIPSYGFLSKFSPDGRTLTAFLAMSALGSAAQYPTSIGLDSEGNVLVAGAAGALPGWFDSTAIQPTVPASVQGQGGFLAKYDADLHGLVWGTYFGDGGFDASIAYNGSFYHDFYTDGVHGLALDGDGNIWITGYAQTSTLPGTNSTSTQTSSYIAEISSDGTSLLRVALSELGGQAITRIAGGTLAVLGGSDSFLLSGSPGQPSFLTVACSANNGSSGTIAPAEMISLYGSGIGPASELIGQVVNGVFTNNLGGYQVLFNGVPAPLLYAGPNQVNVVAPAALAMATKAQISVNGPQDVTVFPTVFVAPSRPQIFSQPGSPNGYPNAIATSQDGSVVFSGANPAGGYLTLWATGTGLGSEQRTDGSITPATPPYQGLPISVVANNGSTLTTLYPPQVTWAGNAPGAVLGLVRIDLKILYSAYVTIGIGSATSPWVNIYSSGLVRLP